MSPNGKLAFHTYSQFETPSVTEVIELPSHKPVRALTDPSAVVAKVKPLLNPPAEFFRIDIGEGVQLDGYMLKPSTFDAIEEVSVHHARLRRAGGADGERFVGRLAAAVPSRARRGRLHHHQHRQSRHAGAARHRVAQGRLRHGRRSVVEGSGRGGAALLAKYPFLDRDRVGVWGWSGGGTNTLNAMFRFPDVYKVGVSVAPVPDQRLYDTIYQERYMGLPQENVEGYKVGSAINFAEGLQGKLLVVHGSGDDNVHAQGTEKLINRLIELGKPFDSMIYPNRTHSISEGAGHDAARLQADRALLLHEPASRSA